MNFKILRNFIYLAFIIFAFAAASACTMRELDSSELSDSAPQVTQLLDANISSEQSSASHETPTPAESPHCTQAHGEAAEEAPGEAAEEAVSVSRPGGYMGPDLEAKDPVTDEFFDDAAFFGNSLVDGLDLLGGITSGDFYGITSASVVNVGTTLNCVLSNGSYGTMLQALAEEQYGKIYILLGINEIGFNTGYFIELYSSMLDSICESQPEADIYIMSLSPVTKTRSDTSDIFNMDRIDEYNSALYELAEEREMYYVDLVDALSDESGYLPAELSTDGIHLQQEKYHEWADYLRSHYAE